MSSGAPIPPNHPLSNLRARIAEVLRAFSEECEQKRAAGICVWINCREPAARVPRSELFFGEDHCREHAVRAEIECLEDEQQYDQKE